MLPVVALLCTCNIHIQPNLRSGENEGGKNMFHIVLDHACMLYSNEDMAQLHYFTVNKIKMIKHSKILT